MSPHTDRVVVLVHGASRSAGLQFRAFLPSAIELGMPLLSPTFSAAGFPGYQRLNGSAGPLSAADAFTRMLDDAQRELGLQVAQVDLIGYSGGAQFVHRYAMVEPRRVRAMVMASAGWFTLLDPNRPFPDGVAASELTCGRTLDPETFLKIPLHLLVGERDVERDSRLRTTRSLDRRQGANRLARALHWIDHLEETGRARGVVSRATFDLLPGTGHSFRQAVDTGNLVERSLAYLRGLDAEPVASTTQPDDVT